MELIPPPVKELEIRELSPAEVETLRPIFESKGATIPDQAIATFVGVVKNGKVVGFQVLQLKLHAQPNYIEPEYSHLFKAMCKKSEELIVQKCGPQWVYLFVEPGRLKELAEVLGMNEEPWAVLSKLVQSKAAPPVFNLEEMQSVTEA